VPGKKDSVALSSRHTAATARLGLGGMRIRLLLALCAASLLVGALAAKDDREELEKAARTMSQLDSYSFTTSYELQGIPPIEGPYEVRGKWQRGIAYFISESEGAKVEGYRMNERSVIRKQGGDWIVPRKDREGGRGIGTPHEILENLHNQVRSVSRSDGFEMVNSRRCVAYEVELTAQGTRDLIPVAGIPLDTSNGGRARIWVDDDGFIQKYFMLADVKVTILGRRFNLRATNTTEISDIGKTRVKPPDEVMRLLKAATPSPR